MVFHFVLKETRVTVSLLPFDGSAWVTLVGRFAGYGSGCRTVLKAHQAREQIALVGSWDSTTKQVLLGCSVCAVHGHTQGSGQGSPVLSALSSQE